MVPADSDKISRVPPYSGYLKSLENFVYRTITYYGLTFQIIQLSSKFVTPYRGPTTPVLRLVWATSFSLATTKEIDFSFFSSGYLDVSVHRVTLAITMNS